MASAEADLTTTEPTRQDPEAHLIVAAARSTVLSLMLGDLRLRTWRPPSDPFRALVSRVLVIPALKAKLRLVAVLSKDKKLAFGLRRRKKTGKVADVRVDIELRPKMPLSPERPAELQFTYALPDFVVNPGDTSSLTLQLQSGKRLRIPQESLPKDLGNDRNKMTAYANVYANVATMLVRWLRQGGQTDMYSLEPGASSKTVWLVNTVMADFRAIWSLNLTGSGKLTGTGILPSGKAVPIPRPDRAIWKEIKEAQAELEKTDPFLGGGFDFSVLRARALIMLNRDGKMVKRIGEKGARQVDLEIGLDFAGDRQVAVLRLTIPDLLVSGPRWQEFSSAFIRLASDQLQDQLTKHANKLSQLGITLGHDGLNELLAGDSGRLSFIRIAADFKRSKGDADIDNDLVILEGTVSGSSVTVLITAVFEVTDHPDVAVRRISDVQLLAVSSVDSKWIWDFEDPLDDYFEYFEGLLLRFKDWQNFAGSPVVQDRVA